MPSIQNQHKERPPRTEETVIYRFGEFELSTLPSQLTRQGTRVTLQPQPARALELLIKNRGKVVSREMIRRHLWGQATYLDHQQGINFAMRKIRVALGDDPLSPRYIETVPRQGYRFVASVRKIQPEAPASGDSTPTLSAAEPRLTKTDAAPSRRRLRGRYGLTVGHRRCGHQKCQAF